MSNGYLIDTNIISKLSPDKKMLPSEAVRRWFKGEGEAGSLYLSAMTVAEIERGLRSLHRRGGTERVKRLSTWLNNMTELFGERILPMDKVVARIAGAMEEMAGSIGHNPDLGDIIIASTAEAYDLTVITENLKHFEPLGVNVELPEVFKQESEPAPIQSQTPRF